MPDPMPALALLYLMIPAYVANMAAPFVRFWPGPNPPVSRRWLGDHKTVGGFVVGIAAGMVAAGVQAGAGWSAVPLPTTHWAGFGFAMGASALVGDSAKSFVKRRLRIAPGARWIPADQLDFVVAALLALRAWVDFDLKQAAIVLAVSFVADLVVNRIAFRLGIKSTPW